MALAWLISGSLHVGLALALAGLSGGPRPPASPAGQVMMLRLVEDSSGEAASGGQPERPPASPAYSLAAAPAGAGRLVAPTAPAPKGRTAGHAVAAAAARVLDGAPSEEPPNHATAVSAGQGPNGARTLSGETDPAGQEAGSADQSEKAALQPGAASPDDPLATAATGEAPQGGPEADAPNPEAPVGAGIALREPGIGSALSFGEGLAQVSPRYPWLSRQRGEEGTVTLAVEVLADGQPGAIRILSSSGHLRLDRAAIQAVQLARFASVGAGPPGAFEQQVTIRFRLE